MRARLRPGRFCAKTGINKRKASRDFLHGKYMQVSQHRVINLRQTTRVLRTSNQVR